MYRKIIRPYRSTYESTRLNYHYTGVRWGEYDHNGIPYDEAIKEVKELLKSAIMVGHDIESDERALCFNIGSVAHCL